MTRFFNRKTLHSSLRFAFVVACLCVGFDLLGQTAADIAEMPRRAIGLTPSDSAIARKGLQLIPKGKYAYIAIHGEGTVFKIVEGNTWRTISHRSLAKWIADNRSYDTMTLVLLSCSDTTSTQLLTNQLAQYDTTAPQRRALRKIIGWDNEVELYENGSIDGYGYCRIFSPQLAGTKGSPRSTLLAMDNAPHGTNQLPDETMRSVVFGVSSAERIKILALTGAQVTAKQAIDPSYLEDLANKWRAFKVDFVRNYLENGTIIKPNPQGPVKPIGTIIQIDSILSGWLTLKHYQDIGRTPLTGDYDVLMSAKTIFEKTYYSATATATPIQAAFTKFLDDGKEPKATIIALASAVDAPTFLTVIQAAGTKMLLNAPASAPTTTALGIAGLPNIQANLKLLNTIVAQRPFVKVVENYLATPSIAPAVNTGMTTALLDQLLLPQKNADGILVKGALDKSYVGAKKYVEDVTPALVAAINKAVGEFVDYNQFLLLTGATGVMNNVATKGSIFEHWGFKKHNTVLPLVLSQVLIRKNPTNVNISAGLSEGKRVIIDFHYPLANGQVVAVEFKHAVDVPVDQLKNRRILLDAPNKVIDRFIYIFAERPEPNIPNPRNSAVIQKILREVGAITEFYYFSNGALIRVP